MRGARDHGRGALRRTLCGAAALAVLAQFITTRPLVGQDGVASLRGVVYDSTSMAVLPGARVAVFGTSATVDADDEGRFWLDGIPAGTHWVSFFHPRLQALGVSPPSRQVVFRAGGTVDVELAVPSEATLLTGWCLAEQRGGGFAAISGIVTDSLTGVPMPRAIVTATPSGRALGAPDPIEVRTDDSGYYRMCAVPANRGMRLQPHFGRSSGRSVEVVLAPGSAQVRDLMLLMSSEGTLTGTVIDYMTGEPVEGATISVLGTNSRTLTDLDGRFVLADLPPGRHLVVTDHLAFEARTDSVTVFSEETVTAEIRLATEVLEIEGLTVTARSRFGRTSLAADVKRADFLTREEIEALLPRVSHAGDLLRNMNVPGLSIRDVQVTDAITGMVMPELCVEVSRRYGGNQCYQAAVFLNEVPLPYPGQILRDLDPNVIERIEILSPIDAQFQFGSTGANGAILIYTR